MPHVLLEGPISLEEFYRSFEPLRGGKPGEVLKANYLFIEKGGKRALLESVAVEEGRHQSFFIELLQRKGGLTVRLLPATDPEKTPGVKRLLALVARRLKSLSPGCRYGKNNIQSFLEED
ncbi:MAG: hypothetical protein ACE5LX_06650 [Nitrospinota bacterium]